MTTQKLSLLLLNVFLVYTITLGQTKEDVFKIYKDKGKTIVNGNLYQKVVLSNKTYGSLTGYFKNDSICAIAEYYKLPHGFQECFFLFEMNELIFINKTQTNTDPFDSTNTYIKFEGLYQMLNSKIIIERVDGEENQEELFDTGDPYPYKENSAEYFLFLAQKDINVLLKKKNRS
jgi:hypothetical protein